MTLERSGGREHVYANVKKSRYTKINTFPPLKILWPYKALKSHGHIYRVVSLRLSWIKTKTLCINLLDSMLTNNTYQGYSAN